MEIYFLRTSVLNAKLDEILFQSGFDVTVYKYCILSETH